MLVSFQFASHKPKNLLALLDNIQQRTANPNEVEVLVKVDDEDEETLEIANREAERRPFTFRVLSAPRGAGFADLWKAYNILYQRTDPQAYFVCLLSDEVRINEDSWDAKLQKYVGLFPDHIFRLRTTRLKLRNYYDFWECGFAPDSFAFHTRRWLEVAGDWNPCTGPDSSQQFIAYYLGLAGYPSFVQFNRDVPIFDIGFSGEGASQGMTEEERQRRNTINFRLWYTLVSHPMQEELFRRARLLQASILRSTQPNGVWEVTTDARRRYVLVTDRATGKTVDILSYKLSRVGLFFANAKRTLHYHYYAGGGIQAWNFWPFNLLDFLVVYYPGLRKALRPVIESRLYWIVREMSGIVARAFKQKQLSLIGHELTAFSASHQHWERTFPITHRVMRMLSRVFS